MEIDDRESRAVGLLFGCAAGDSLGLPGERLGRKRWASRFPGPLRQRFLFGHGMVSDDTELSILVTQAVLSSAGDSESFLLSLSWRLRYWLLFLPSGCGWATLRAVLRLWCGVSCRESGVKSAGNGAAVRSAVLGALFPDPIERHDFVRLSTRLTHRDERAFVGALAVAEMAALTLRVPVGRKPEMAEVSARLRMAASGDAEWTELVDRMETGWRNAMTVEAFADSLGLAKGVSGYVYHTVPVAIYGWFLHYGDVAATLESVIKCGGDTDSTGAIAGALAGAAAGESGIPPEYLNRICDYPWSVTFLRRLGEQLARFSKGVPATVVPTAYWAIPFRNLLFGATVYVHILLRLLLFWR